MTTTPDSTETVAIVASSNFDYGPADVDSEVSAPAGKDFAEFVERHLVAHGAKRLATAVTGEEGWTFDVDIRGKRFRVFVHWAPIGDPPADRWVIQSDICKPLFRSLFERKTADHEIEPIVRELRRVLDDASEIEEVIWVSQKEFRSMY